MRPGVREGRRGAIRVGQIPDGKAITSTTKKPPKGERLEDIVKLARAAGVSYGEYSAMLYMQKKRTCDEPPKLEKPPKRYYTKRKQQEHICIDCGKTFLASAYNVKRCLDCRELWENNYQKMYQRRKKMNNDIS